MMVAISFDDVSTTAPAAVTVWPRHPLWDACACYSRGGPSMSRGRGGGGGRPERTADYGASSRDSYPPREQRDRDYGR